MGNGKSSSIKKKDSKVRDSAPGVDLPVLRVDGIAFGAVSNTLGKLREGKENQVDEDKLLSYNFLDSFEGDKLFSDICVLGHVNATPGCSLYVSNCQDDGFLLKVDIGGIECRSFGIFDGHGKKDGDKVAKSCALLFQDFFKNKESICTKSGDKLKINQELPTKPNLNSLISEPKVFFEDSFKLAHEIVCSANDYSAKEAGTTATVATMIDNHLHIAWVGDSQAALFVTASEDFDNFKSYFVSSKHNFQTEAEKQRVADCGGRLGHANNLFGKIDPFSSAPIRIFGKRGNGKPGLMISKSLGDKNAHQIGLTCEPSFLSLDFGKIKTFGDLVSNIPDLFNASSYLQESKAKPPSKVSRRQGKGNSFQSTLGRVRKRVNSTVRTLGAKKKSRMQISNLTEESLKKPMDLAANSHNNLSGEMIDMNQEIKHSVLIIGSDGLWDQISKEDICRLLPSILKDKAINPKGLNIGFELGLKAIEKFRASFETPTTSAKSDDISVVASVLF